MKDFFLFFGGYFLLLSEHAAPERRALPWLRCAGCAAPPWQSRWPGPRWAPGGSGCRPGGGCGRAECRSPTTAASSAPEGCPLNSQRSLPETTDKQKGGLLLQLRYGAISSPDWNISTTVIFGYFGYFTLSSIEHHHEVILDGQPCLCLGLIGQMIKKNPDKMDINTFLLHFFCFLNGGFHG